MYHKLCGMTGTATTEAGEFWSIYKLDVVEIPTNRVMARIDHQDYVYRTIREKYNAVAEEIVRLTEAGRPVLVGTTSVEISELLSRMLKLRGIKHNVLNAKYHEKEAEIIAQAGQKGSVTIATNMAGRGTDIVLGGNSDFMAKSEMRRMQFSEELITEAVSHAETVEEEILKARKTYRELVEKYRKQIHWKKFPST